MCNIRFNSNDLNKVANIVYQHHGYIENDEVINIPVNEADRFYQSILSTKLNNTSGNSKNTTMKCCFISMSKKAS